MNHDATISCWGRRLIVSTDGAIHLLNIQHDGVWQLRRPFINGYISLPIIQLAKSRDTYKAGGGKLLKKVGLAGIFTVVVNFTQPKLILCTIHSMRHTHNSQKLHSYSSKMFTVLL